MLVFSHRQVQRSSLHGVVTHCLHIYIYVSRSTYIYIYGYIYPYMVVASRWADLVVIIRALPAYLVRNPHPYMFIYMHKHVRMYLHILHILYSRFST
jgi:hypothetical protein